MMTGTEFPKGITVSGRRELSPQIERAFQLRGLQLTHVAGRPENREALSQFRDLQRSDPQRTAGDGVLLLTGRRSVWVPRPGVH